MFYHGLPVARIAYVDVTCQSALSRVAHMPFRWSLNPYQGCFHGCVYCFARAHAKLADRDPGQGFSSRIGVKVNLVDVLRRELASRRWMRETVAFGTATDPYQPIEGTLRLTRRCLEALADFRTPVSLITKGTMVVRDIDVLVRLASRAPLTVTFSVPTVAEDVWRATEPGTPPPRQRLRALTRLVESGIEAGVGMAPILPGLSDSPHQLEATVAAAAKAGACYVWANLVYLKPGTREYFLAFLEREYPELVGRYLQLYPGAYAPSAQRTGLQEAVAALRKRHAVSDQRLIPVAPPRPPEQLALIG